MLLPFLQFILALSVPMLNQVTERALKALASASEVVFAERKLLTGGRGGGVAFTLVGSTPPLGATTSRKIEKK